MAEPLVVKVGGSLLAWPPLRTRLSEWLNAQGAAEVVLVPGGGAAADVVRDLDGVHGLGDEAAHWLAIRAMTLNAHVLAALLPRARVVSRPAEMATAWAAGVLPVLDCLPMLLDDEACAQKLPHSWDATSDAIAARVAEWLGARVVLLKSADPAAGPGGVDAVFPVVVRRGNLRAAVVNLRAEGGGVSLAGASGERADGRLFRLPTATRRKGDP